MASITINLNFEVYNNETEETFDRKSVEMKLDYYWVKYVAKVMNEHGGFAPELEIFDELDNHIFEECIMYYQDVFAPDDEHFWDEYTLEVDNVLPEALRLEAEKLVTHKDVDVTYYYMDGDGEITGQARLALKPEDFAVLVDVVKRPHQDKTDFAFLAEEHADVYGRVVKGVAEKAGREDFELREFPYVVLEMAMEE